MMCKMSYYKDYLDSKGTTLLENTRLNLPLLQEFCNRDLICKAELRKLIRLEEYSDKQNYEFWEIIKTQPDPLETSIEIFQKHRNFAIVEVLKKAIPDGQSDQKLNSKNSKLPLTVNVIKPIQYTPQGDDFYKLDPSNGMIGAALIINITIYENTRENRLDARPDYVYMRDLWGQLGYKIFSLEGPCMKKQLMDEADKMLKYFDDNKAAQSCVVFIGCHGENGKIIVTDGKDIPVYDCLVQKFTDRTSLLNKPKIFIFQSCQGIPEADSEKNILTRTKDTILCFPAVPGATAEVDKYLGSWFVYALADVFMREAYRMEIHDMLNEVQNVVKTKFESQDNNQQQPYWVDSDMLQKLYFNVRP